ncbi:MAG: hypothetical protein MJ200_05735 [Mycoplasmoidaceae bacterium]|nr:hypothetical protein [Mycoplasmoidaceae bacterium]
MHSNQEVEVKPNTRYNITIDMTKHEISSYQSLSFYFQFGDAVESDTPLVDLSNDFIFNAIDIDKNS